MKVPKNYFENLSTIKYREYLKLLPKINMQQETTRSFVTLALTFAALSFFGIFAINPTLTTIADLQKQLSDDQQVDQQLKTKIDNLSALEAQYNQLGAGSDLTNIYNAIPQTPAAPLLSAQVFALTTKHNLSILSYSVSAVQLTTTQKVPTVQSFTFTLQTTGIYTDMLAFTSELAKLNRIITVESIEIGRDSNGNLVLTLRGRQYFKQL
jgi:Tfp pilus assembly protein PilO